MIFDDIDFLLIRQLYFLKKGESTNTYQLAKKIYRCNYYDLHNKRSIVVSRLKKMSGYGLIKIQNNSPTTYTLINENVLFRKVKFMEKLKDTISLKVNGKWCCFEM